MSSKIFRIFNPGAPKEDPVHKRRAQLRRAQRSYRDRKELYTKSLEEEVARSKAREADLNRQCKQYRETIEVLSQLLFQHGIESTVDLDVECSILRHREPRQQTNVFRHPWTPEDSVSPESFNIGLQDVFDTITSPDAAAEDPAEFTDKPPPDSMSLSARRPEHYVAWKDSHNEMAKPESPAALRNRLCDIDQVVVGMEFVLTIESPCRGHLHGDPDQRHKPTGHALTTSAQLISITSDIAPSSTGSCIPSYEGAPTELLNRLLELSSNLCPEDEITPTQAWKYLRSQPQFGGLEMSNFHALTSKLREAVKCHGFGAVMDRAMFESLVFSTLLIGRKF